MKNQIIAFVLLLSTVCGAAGYDNSIGVGVQHGGVFGWQGAIVSEDVNLRFAVGVIGISLGFDYIVTDHVAVGVTGGYFGA